LKIEIKYGLLITLGVILWTIPAHLLVPDPCSAVHQLGPLVVFNLLQIAGIFLGASARKRTSAPPVRFKTLVKTGVGISFVYGLGACVFFLLAILVQPQIMCRANGTPDLPFWKLALGAFAGLFIGALIFGLIYSTVTAFILADRSRE